MIKNIPKEQNIQSAHQVFTNKEILHLQKISLKGVKNIIKYIFLYFSIEI